MDYKWTRRKLMARVKFGAVEDVWRVARWIRSGLRRKWSSWN